jgi:hypothetical protein
VKTGAAVPSGAVIVAELRWQVIAEQILGAALEQLGGLGGARQHGVLVGANSLADGRGAGEREREVGGVTHGEVDTDAEWGHEVGGVTEQVTVGSWFQTCGRGSAKIGRSTYRPSLSLIIRRMRGDQSANSLSRWARIPAVSPGGKSAAVIQSAGTLRMM